MKLLTILLLFYSTLLSAQHFGTRHPDGTVTNDADRPHHPPYEYYMKGGGGNIKPCGDGTHGTRPCAIPLTDYLPLLIIAGAVVGIKKLRNI